MEERVQAKVVEAEELVIRDSQGRVSISITSDLDGNPAIQLLDRNGTKRLELRVQGESTSREQPAPQAQIMLLDSNGKTRASMMADDSFANVHLRDKDGNTAILLSIVDTKDFRFGPDLWLEGQRGKVLLKQDLNGLPHLVLEDQAGYPRIHLTVDEHGQPHVFRHRVCDKFMGGKN